MCPMKVDPLMRRWFAGPALMLWLGIYLSGFENVHWLVYVPATMALFALVTGMCPGMYLICKRGELIAKWRNRR